jgi:Flp pilus assembly protein TadD
MKRIEIPPFSLDAEKLVLYRDGQIERIPPKTIEVLAALLERRGEIVTKGELLSRVWGDVVVEESNLTVHVSLLRRTLGDAAPIETIPKRGYRVPLARPGSEGASAASREATLRGRYFWNKLTRFSLERAAKSFEAALTADAANGDARSGFADTFLMQGLFGFDSDRSAFTRAREHAEAAVAVSPTSWESRISLAFASLFDRWDFATADAALVDARRLAPDSSAPRTGAALLAAIRGDGMRALEEARAARDKDPLSLQAGVGLGFHSYLAQQLAPQIEPIQLTLELEPDFAVAHWALGLALDRLGRHTEAELSHRRAFELSGGSPTIESVLARSLALAGRSREAGDLRDALASAGLSPYRLATIACALADFSSALDELERCVAARDPWLVWVRVDPMLESLRREPRFAAVERAAFEAAASP